MGKYSELIGSFKRMGSFPMEANFIFENETALKDFYSSPEEAATLHKGLLKLVADSATGKQSLWWVTKKQTNDELEFTKLIDSTSVESLEKLAEKLEKEIYDRQVADDAIYGSSDHTVVPEDLNSLLKIAEAIAELREAIKEDGGKVDTIKEELKATVGTELDDIREYLKTLDYQSLTAVSKELHRFLATREPDTDSIDTFPELLDFLAGFKDTDVLQDVLDTLVADIMGDPLPTEPFRTLRGIEDFVREFKAQSENTDANLQTELDQTQVGVGLSGDGAYNPDKETYYLKDATSVMNALKILDSLINEAINNCNLEVEDTNTVDLTINKQTTKTVLSADVKISTNDGNGIQVKNDGLFYKLETEYENGILTVKVNDNIISRHTIGLSTIVESAKYDPDQEAIIMVFKLLDGSKQELVIPVGTLIREWEVDNSHPTKVVVLEKEDVLGGGTDKLSADVRLYVDKYQILEKRDNTLYVKGTTDNLTHNDEALDVVIDRIISSGSDTNDALQAEIDRAKAAEQALDNKITAETTRADKVETQLRNDLDAEIKRATGVETDLQKQIDNLQDSTSTDISELEAALKAEVERSTEKDAAHDTAISEEVARATEAENQLRRDLTTTNEKVTANTANIEKNADAIAKETERATAAESSLSDGLRAEIERATTKETELEGAITTHINDTNNPHNVTKEQVGLGKVDNTTDLEKPVSVATQAALDTKADKTYVDAQLDTKAPIDSPVFKGNPQVENPPAPNDSSNRIPSTAWVNETIKNSVSDGLEAHIKDFNNPHKVTAEQTGAYTKEQVDGLLDTKADLVDGKIPADQLPDDVKDSVHYDGTWDAATNSPALVPGDKDSTGKYYLVTSNGVFDGIQYNKGDLIINADGQWIKIDNTDLVTSVNGKIGDVVIRIADIENLQNILDSKANSSDVYTKQEIDNKLADLLNQHTQDIENVQQSITNIEGDITNLTNNKADLIDGKIPTNQLPDSIIGGMKYMGTWSAKDNDPQLNNGDPTQDGWYYIVSEAGERFGEVFDVKDWVVNSKGTWGKIDNVDSVVSVNGKKGIVIIEIGDIPGLKDAIDKGGTGLEDHITDYNNPHRVTAEQVGSYTKEETNNLLSNKADLVNGIIPENQIPTNIRESVHYEGTWDAETNAPALKPQQPEANGFYYLVTVAGRFNGVDYEPGDLILNAGGQWVKIDNSDLVTSVNGMIGDVIINIQDIPGLEDKLNGAEGDFSKINKAIEEIRNNIINLTNNKADLEDGVVPENQLPETIKGCLKYHGSWNAADNDPMLSNDDVDKEGWYYIVSSAGTRFNNSFAVGDWVVNSGGTWTRVNNADAVISVNGQSGIVNIEIDDIPGLKDALDSTDKLIDDHIRDFNNPHKVTKDQIGLGKVENYSPAEMPISNAVQTEITRIDKELLGAATDLTAHIKDTNNPHQTTKEQVGLGKVDNTSDLEKPISVPQQNEFNRVDRELDKKALQTDLAAHVSDFNNPHHVTKEQVGLGKVDNTSDLEKPISIAVQEALNNIKIDATGYATKEELTNHINDKNNPHNVTKEQIGLGNVDNTSDMNKPISTATQMALDKKADVHHSHTMTDITDLENLPIIKGFVTVLSELPESATGGDKYIMSTQVGSGSTRYTLLEFDGATGTWKQKLLTTGGIAAVIDGDVWELTSKGIKRVLDADDYKYFYDKVWGETKDLVQSIEWDDTVSNKIRLKVTTKKSYADPNTDEATKPTVTPKVTYIDIEKERFMSSAYSRPATQEDVNNGYASKVGVPVLVIELTTGDEIVIDLTDTMNIYDPIDTSSINMEVSNWTGTAATSYKISATLKIAENSDAVKLVDNGTSGVYARLDKKNTNSIQMVDDGSLSANLVIDTAKNNLSDILLTIGAAGLSAQFIVGEYD